MRQDVQTKNLIRQKSMSAKKLLLDRNGKVVGIRNLYATKVRGMRGVFQLSYRVNSVFVDRGYVYLDHKRFILDNSTMPEVAVDRPIDFPVVRFFKGEEPQMSFGKMDLDTYLQHLQDVSFLVTYRLEPLVGRLRVSRAAQDAEAFPSLEDLQSSIEQRGGPALWQVSNEFVEMLVKQALDDGVLPPEDQWAELVAQKSASRIVGDSTKQPLPVVKYAVRDLIELARAQGEKIDRLLALVDALRIQIASGLPAVTTPIERPILPSGGLTVRPVAKVRPKPSAQRHSGPVSFEADLQGDVGALAEIAAIRDNK